MHLSPCQTTEVLRLARALEAECPERIDWLVPKFVARSSSHAWKNKSVSKELTNGVADKHHVGTPTARRRARRGNPPGPISSLCTG